MHDVHVFFMSVERHNPSLTTPMRSAAKM